MQTRHLRQNPIRRVWVVAVFLALVAGAFANAPIIRAIRMDPPPVIDGVVDEATEWKNAAHIEGLVDRLTSEPAPENSQFWLGYDSKYLYFAAKLHDSKPNTIKAIETRTNASVENDDNIELDVSPSGNLSDFDAFQMNPNGANSVLLAGGRSLKREWIGDILSKARITKDGWEAEARIPLKLFRLPGAGKHDFRFNVFRFMPRTNRQYVYTFTGNGLTADTPVWSGILLPSLPTDHSIQLLPYIDGGYDRDQGGAAGNVGLDMKTKLNNDVTLVGTINPDFRDVEDQVLSLDFSRLARLAGESRPFFLEGSDYLSSNIFSSQLIQRVDAGLNAYGRVDARTTFGILDTVSFGHEDDLASTVTFAPNPDERYVAAVTHLSDPGLENDAFNLRYNRRMGKFAYGVSAGGSDDTLTHWGDTESFNFSYRDYLLRSFIRYNRTTGDFDPRLGFVPETDFQGPSVFLLNSSLPKKGVIQDEGYNVSALSFTHLSGAFYRDDVRPSGYVAFRNQLVLSGSLDFAKYEGEYDHTLDLSASYPYNDPRRNVSFDYTTGVQEIQNYHDYSLSLNFQSGLNLSGNISYQIVQLGSSYQQQAILTGTYLLGHDRSVSGRLIQTNDGTNFFMSFQQSGNRGVEYFLILGDPNGEELVNSHYLINVRPSLIFKVAIPIQIGKSG